MVSSSEDMLFKGAAIVVILALAAQVYYLSQQQPQHITAAMEKRIASLEAKIKTLEAPLATTTKQSKESEVETTRKAIVNMWKELSRMQTDVEEELKRNKEIIFETAKRMDGVKHDTDAAMSGAVSRGDFVEQRVVRMDEKINEIMRLIQDGNLMNNNNVNVNSNSNSNNNNNNNNNNNSPPPQQQSRQQQPPPPQQQPQSLPQPPPQQQRPNVPQPSSRDLVTMVPQGFKAALDDGFDFVVMFHAPWCGHCKQMMPKFEQAAKRANAVFARIDCAEYPDVASSQNIQGFPTIKRYRSGRQVDVYKGDRTVESLIQFAA